MSEHSDAFACFGSTCHVFVMGDGPRGSAERAVAVARRCLLGWHDRFTRFEEHSELSRLNADPRQAVPVSEIMGRFVAAVRVAAQTTGGLVDATLLGELERAGYDADLGDPMALDRALALAPARRPAGPRAASRWPEVGFDPIAGVARRPPGVRLDSGGLAKGLFADILAGSLAEHEAFAIDCAGDLRIGGRAAVAREVRVESPFDATVLHAFELVAGGVATSGIGRRSWMTADGHPAHHLLDPATGRPAYTGVVQATALAPTAVEAEVRAKAAVLSGPGGAAAWLADGGVVVLDDGRHVVVEASDVRRAVASGSAPSL